MNELNELQKQQLEEYKKECFTWGVKTGETDRLAAYESITKLYKAAGFDKPKFVFVPGTLHAQAVMNVYDKDELFNEISCIVKENGEEGKDAYDYVNEIVKEIFPELSPVLTKKKTKVGKVDIKDPVKNKIATLLVNFFNEGALKFFYTNFWGQQDYFWIAFYKFPEKFLDVKYPEQESELLQVWEDLAKAAGWWWPFEGLCIVADRPTKMEYKLVDNRIQLHSETGPALQWADGWGLYYLNGVRVPKELVMTPPAELHGDMILHEENVEVRREIVRKLGPERIVRDLDAKILDENGDYTLYEVPLGLTNPGHYLRMRNPSIDTWHFECVPHTCKTVKEARIWRRGGIKNDPAILT